MVDQADTPALLALPFELLKEITLIAIGYYDDLGFPHPDALETYDGPQKYSQICSRWRSIVLASPKAWSDIIIVKPYSNYDMSRLESYFDLSKDAILRVYIDLDKPDSALLDMVFTRIKTRRLIELGLHIPREMSRYLQELQPRWLATTRRLCLLQTIVSCSSSSSQGRISDGTPGDIIPLPSILSSASLVSLSISLPDNIEGKDLLAFSRLRDLMTLSIHQLDQHRSGCDHNKYSDLSNTNHSTIIEFYHLKELKKVHHFKFIQNKKISCPALETLDITEPHPSHVYTFIKEGSLCSLVNLTLRSCDVSSQLLNIFRLLPDLLSLRIFVAQAGASVSVLLSRLSMSLPNGPPCLLPRLQVLDITMDYPLSEWKNELFLWRLLTARWNLPPVLLKTVVFQWKRLSFLSSELLLPEFLDRGGHKVDTSYYISANGIDYCRTMFLYQATPHHK